jgi:uncharacterized phage-like protein YoqJ
MEQTTIFKKNKKSCAFTGHRNLGEDLSEKVLENAVKTAIKEGVETFYCGMAMGFDLLAAETVLLLKKDFPKIRLVACVPCYGQEKSFSKEDKTRYVEALKNADEQIILSERYYRGCMQVRDKYMAERADMLIAYCKKETGGAAYTVKIFQKLFPDGEIVFL